MEKRGPVRWIGGRKKSMKEGGWREQKGGQRRGPKDVWSVKCKLNEKERKDEKEGGTVEIDPQLTNEGKKDGWMEE